jgi:hypothetical protein
MHGQADRPTEIIDTGEWVRQHRTDEFKWSMWVHRFFQRSSMMQMMARSLSLYSLAQYSGNAAGARVCCVLPLCRPLFTSYFWFWFLAGRFAMSRAATMGFAG